jgi:hypothetical protein
MKTMSNAGNFQAGSAQKRLETIRNAGVLFDNGVPEYMVQKLSEQIGDMNPEVRNAIANSLIKTPKLSGKHLSLVALAGENEMAKKYSSKTIARFSNEFLREADNEQTVMILAALASGINHDNDTAKSCKSQIEINGRRFIAIMIKIVGQHPELAPEFAKILEYVDAVIAGKIMTRTEEIENARRCNDFALECSGRKKSVSNGFEVRGLLLKHIEESSGAELEWNMRALEKLGPHRCGYVFTELFDPGAKPGLKRFQTLANILRRVVGFQGACKLELMHNLWYPDKEEQDLGKAELAKMVEKSKNPEWLIIAIIRQVMVLTHPIKTDANFGPSSEARLKEAEFEPIGWVVRGILLEPQFRELAIPLLLKILENQNEKAGLDEQNKKARAIALDMLSTIHEDAARRPKSEEIEAIANRLGDDARIKYMAIRALNKIDVEDFTDRTRQIILEKLGDPESCKFVSPIALKKFDGVWMEQAIVAAMRAYEAPDETFGKPYIGIELLKMIKQNGGKDDYSKQLEQIMRDLHVAVLTGTMPTDCLGEIPDFGKMSQEFKELERVFSGDIAFAAALGRERTTEILQECVRKSKSIGLDGEQTLGKCTDLYIKFAQDARNKKTDAPLGGGELVELATRKMKERAENPRMRVFREIARRAIA